MTGSNRPFFFGGTRLERPVSSQRHPLADCPHTAQGRRRDSRSPARVADGPDGSTASVEFWRACSVATARADCARKPDRPPTRGMVWLGVGVGVGVVVLDVIFFEVFVGVLGVIGVVGVVELLFPSEPRLG